MDNEYDARQLSENLSLLCTEESVRGDDDQVVGHIHCSTVIDVLQSEG